ncbi:MAG TPA: hypothetical protein DCG77_10155 [Sphingobacterium sp.]|nr:hypothetical protein HMPREF3127_20690 [Sphingobacterium sp. HMSC13C05]HAE67550.1 hypothetical protein [Sphingobacterium sp.]HAL51778.1 hypothetical protein [Sphingobacterium sp.]HBI86360.1 hypothetical protein [Sphingobacterium sp.]
MVDIPLFNRGRLIKTGIQSWIPVFIIIELTMVGSRSISSIKIITVFGGGAGLFPSVMEAAEASRVNKNGINENRCFKSIACN